MPDADSHLPGRIYCRKCGYDLRGQAGDGAHRCPECGRGFDPADGKTFLTRPPRGAGWRWARRGVILLLAVGILLGMGWGWLYWGWKNEQAALARMRAQVWFVEPLGGDLLKEGYFGSAGWVLDRARDARCPQSTTDADLIYLKELKWLSWLDLRGTQVTDAGLFHLKELEGLRLLDLSGTQVTDAGLVHLKTLKRLQRLDLYRTQVTDVGLVQLGELKALKRLDLIETKVTTQAVEKLRAALPGAQIYGP